MSQNSSVVRCKGPQTSGVKIMPLYHWEICMEADASAKYIPFSGTAPGSEQGKHSVRLGCENDHEYAKQWALDIFPLARIVAVYETNCLCDRLRMVECDGRYHENRDY